MPVPFVPYAPQPQMAPSPPGAPPCQIVCNGCRTLLIYPHGAASVRCSMCGTITPIVPAAGTEMAQVICGGCHTLLLYPRGASSVHCSCCHTVNLTIDGNQIAHVNCGGCGTTLMYPFGAPSVKCALCQFVTSIGMSNTRMPMPPPQIPSANMVQPAPPSQQSIPPTQHTVLVENPMTRDESGNLVSNMAVGVSTEKK